MPASSSESVLYSSTCFCPASATSGAHGLPATLGTAPARAVRTSGSSNPSCGMTAGPFGFSSTAATETAGPADFPATAPPAFSGAFEAIHCRICSICQSGNLSAPLGM